MEDTITGILDAFDSIEVHGETNEVGEVKNHAQGHTVSRPQSWPVLVSICPRPVPSITPLPPLPHTQATGITQTQAQSTAQC